MFAPGRVMTPPAGYFLDFALTRKIQTDRGRSRRWRKRRTENSSAPFTFGFCAISAKTRVRQGI
jgi:hypothetical protein